MSESRAAKAGARVRPRKKHVAAKKAKGKKAHK